MEVGCEETEVLVPGSWFLVQGAAVVPDRLVCPVCHGQIPLEPSGPPAVSEHLTEHQTTISRVVLGSVTHRTQVRSSA